MTRLGVFLNRVLIVAMALAFTGMGCAGGNDFEVEPQDGEQDAWTSTDTGDGDDTEDVNSEPEPQLPFPEPCDLFAQDCPTFDGRRTSCVPSPSAGEPRCIVLAESRESGEPCGGNHHCAAGSACILHPGEEIGRCSLFCDRATPAEGCLEEELCTGSLSGMEGVGYCRDAPIPCDIYVQDCREGFACVLGRHPVTGERGTFCGQAGNARVGEACAEAGEPCMAGLICVRDADDQPRCHQICAEAAECAAPMSCTGQTADLSIGYCRA